MGSFFNSYSERLSKFGVISFAEYVSERSWTFVHIGVITFPEYVSEGVFYGEEQKCNVFRRVVLENNSTFDVENMTQ